MKYNSDKESFTVKQNTHKIIFSHPDQHNLSLLICKNLLINRKGFIFTTDPCYFTFSSYSFKPQLSCIFGELRKISSISDIEGHLIEFNKWLFLIYGTSRRIDAAEPLTIKPFKSIPLKATQDCLCRLDWTKLHVHCENKNVPRVFCKQRRLGFARLVPVLLF